MSQAARLPEIQNQMIPFHRQQMNGLGERTAEERNFYASLPEDYRQYQLEDSRQFQPDDRRQFQRENTQQYYEDPTFHSYLESPNFYMEKDREMNYQPTPYKVVMQPLVYSYNPYAYNYMSAAFGNYHHQLF